MVLKLYGHTISPPSRLVAAVLYEKEIQFEFISVDLFKGEHKKPEYVAKNPFGQVPCIDDNGFILYEARAICRYLDETYPNKGTKLIPLDPKKRALMDQAIFTEVCNFDQQCNTIIFESIIKKTAFGKDPDTENVKQATERLAAKLDVYEKLLSKQKYIAGDELTLADLYHLGGGSLLPKCGVNVIQDRPNVARWFDEVSNRPSWQKVKDGLSSA